MDLFNRLSMSNLLPLAKQLVKMKEELLHLRPASHSQTEELLNASPKMEFLDVALSLLAMETATLFVNMPILLNL